MPTGRWPGRAPCGGRENLEKRALPPPAESARPIAPQAGTLPRGNRGLPEDHAGEEPGQPFPAAAAGNHLHPPDSDKEFYMQVKCLSKPEQLAPYADDWDRLSAGVPFRSWTWLSTWWRHYGRSGGASRQRRLYVLATFDPVGTLVGLAPWYLEAGRGKGRTVRMLGGGEVCSDYLGVLCQPGLQEPVTAALAERLTADARAPGRDPRRWDLLELTGVDAADRGVGLLLEQLAQRGNRVDCRPGPNCWRIELPADWNDYLATLSKSHRKQLRRLQRNYLDEGRAVMHSVEHLGDLPEALDILVDLHQRRRQALGEPGCFASARFQAFHREVMPELLRRGQLQLHWLELQRRPAAAEYQLAGSGVVYAYQAGVEPGLLDHQPGRLITLATLRRAIEQGFRAFDLLRGDEPYKAHFRAEPRPGLVVRVVPKRTSARLRHGLWRAGNRVKGWIKGGLKRAAARDS